MNHPPTRIQASNSDLIALSSGIRRFAVVGEEAVWTEAADGKIRVLGPTALDLADFFEVFPLQVNEATPPRRLDWRVWPFQTYRTDIVSHLEWLTPVGAPVSTERLGPGEAPAEASQICDTEAGLLFTGGRGERLLIASDPFPYRIVCTTDAEEIDTYLADCSLKQT